MREGLQWKARSARGSGWPDLERKARPRVFSGHAQIAFFVILNVMKDLCR